MTTIAYDGRFVAADSLQGSSDYDSPVSAVKLVQKGNAVYAICGYFAWFDAWITWHINGADPMNTPVCKYDRTDTAFIVFQGGACVSYSMELPYPDEAFPGEAFGSGRKYAMGAMAMGANATEAVKIAIKLDPGSGGAVQVVDLHELQKEDAA